MSLRKYVLAFTVLVCLAGAASAQSLEDTTVVPLIVDKGFPLQVVLAEKLRFKENETVRATVIEPVYAFDRAVIPSGSKVEGKITAFKKAGKWKRFFKMLGGDFTPEREPQISFHTLVLPVGKRISIETSVGPGAYKTVGPGNQDQSAAAMTSALRSKVKPSKERITGLLWGLSPYHPQSLSSGTRLSAVLLQPVEFGVAFFDNSELEKIGTAPPPDTIVSVRLTTPLNSGTARPGTPVEALTTRPLFSEEQLLVLPAGSVLRGTVTEARAAKSFQRNGELGFSFTTVAPPDSLIAGMLEPHQIDGSLVSAEVTRDMKNMRISGDGAARIVESKARFVAPVWAFIKAGRSLNDTAEPFGDALLSGYRGKFLKQFGSGGGTGLGLAASITGAMVPPVGIGLSVFSVAKSLYSTFLGRGQDISIPANTEMEIRLEKVVPVRPSEEF